MPRKKLVPFIEIICSYVLQIKVYVDPKTFKPDLYAAASINDTAAVLDYLNKQTPGTYIDTKTGWTVNVFYCLCF